MGGCVPVHVRKPRIQKQGVGRNLESGGICAVCIKFVSECSICPAHIMLLELSSIVNVGIVPNSGAVFSAFAKCLQSLPNLHTLQIGGIIGPVEMPIKTAFKGYRFPQIRTVVFPTLAHHILSSCPQVRNVTCTGHHQDKVVNVIAKRCKKVEALCIMALSNDRLKSKPSSLANDWIAKY